VTLSVLLEPRHDTRVLRAGGEVDTAITVDIARRHSVGSHVCCVDLMRSPVRRLEPDHAASVAATPQNVRLAVSVQVGDDRIRRPFLVGGDQVFLPGLGDVGRLLPQANQLPAGPLLAALATSGRPSPLMSPTET